VRRLALAALAFALAAPAGGGLNVGTTGGLKDVVGKLDKKAAANAPAPDTQPPTVPANLSAAGASSGTISLGWTASTDNVGVTNYRVYRNSSASPVAVPTTTTYLDGGLSVTTVYSYTVSACDAAGNCSAQSASASTATLSTGGTPASVPAGLTAVAGSSVSINLSWTASSDRFGAVKNYKVYRNSSASPVAVPTTTTYLDAGLAASTTYSYAVSACDALGNCTALSASTATTTLSPTGSPAPSAPTGLSAVAASSVSISLSWTPSVDLSGTISNYEVYRVGSVVGAPIGAAFTDTGLSASTPYSYTVSACDTLGKCSALSAAAGATTLAAPPAIPGVPAGLAVTASGGSTLSLTWTATSGATSYNVYRNGGASPAASPTAAAYNDTGLAASTTYSYTVSACNISGCSAQSSAAADNTPKWAFVTGGYIQSSPAIGTDGTIYVGSADGKLYAVNSSGSVKWSYLTGSGIFSSPAIGSDGTVYVGSQDASLYALNPNGTLKWSLSLVFAIFSSPAISSDGTTLYVGSGSNLISVSTGGYQNWSFAAGGQVASAPAIAANGTVYVGSAAGSLVALSSAGVQSWAIGTSSPIVSSPAIGADGTVFVGSENGALIAVSSAGAQRWSFSTSASIRSSPAISTDGATVYIGNQNGALVAVSTMGVSRWSFSAGGAVGSSPAVGADGTVYVGADNGGFYAVNPNGTQKWAFVTGNSVESSPAIGSDGTVYVGGYDDDLYAVPGTTALGGSSPWPKYRHDLLNTGFY
jgi:outer membrane protein assembly factor BamB